MIQYIYRKKSQLVTMMLFVLALGLATSCQDVLDEQPISEIGPKNFWKNSADAQAGVAAIYDAMQSTYRVKHYLWGEFRSDDFIQSSQAASQDNSELVLQGLSNGNAPALRWNELYKIINRANDAIKYLPGIAIYDENLLAEAHALRAYAYFDAIRVWGAVPLFTEPVEGISDIQRKRTDGTKILNEVIIPDMLKAEELMGTSNSNFRFSRVSVYCLQAEVYMWLKQYDKAKIALDNMIDEGGHSLVTSVSAWEDMFYNNVVASAVPDGRGKIQTGTELIFSIRYSITEDRDNPGSSFANRSGVMELFFAGIPSFYISPTVENKWINKFPIDKAGWEAKYPGVAPVLTQEVSTTVGGVLVTTTEPVYGDWRYYACREGGFAGYGSKGIGEARMAKWNKTNYNRSFDDTDIVIYRYAGMLLLLAEAENQLGSTIGDVNTSRALALVNQVRTARKLPLVTASEFGATKAARQNYILDERQLELFGEGKRWWDLRRTGKALEVLNPILATIPGTTQLTNNRLLFPVYVDHLIENPNLLPQNVEYN